MLNKILPSIKKNNLNNFGVSWGTHVFVSCLIIAISLAVAIFLGRVADKKERSEFSQLAQTMVYAIDPEKNLVDKLKADIKDLSRPEYIETKKRMTELCDTAKNIRFIYLMKQVNGKILFSSDTQPTGAFSSSDLTIPGEEYNDAPPELRNTFLVGSISIAGPYTDRWGTFVSAFVPIKNSADGKIIAVLGVDITADQWIRTINFGYIYSFFIGVIFVIGYLGIVHYRNKANKPSEEDFTIHYNKKLFH